MRARHPSFLPAAVLVIACALAPGEARAADVAAAARPWSVAWRAPPECPSQGDLDARLTRLLAASHPAETLAAEVDVDRTRRGAWRASLRTRVGEATGERRLVAATCDLLASAAALVLALTLDPDLRPEPEPAPPDVPAPAPPPEPSATAEEPRAPVLPPASGTWSATVGLDVAIDTGSLPSLAPGGRLAVGARSGALALEAYGELWASQRATSAERPGAGGDFALLGVGLRACARTAGVVALGACAGAELDRARADGFGVSDPSAASRWWVAPEAAAELALRPLPHMEVPLRLEALVPLARPTFALENVGDVFRPAPLALRASLGIVVRFW